MKKAIIVIVLMLVCGLGVPTYANSIYGMQGLFAIPVADTQAFGEYTGSFQMIANSTYIGFDYGLLEDLELYLSAAMSNGFTNMQIQGGAKYRVIRENRIIPSLSIGAMNKDVYVVASKTLEPKLNIRAHLGYGLGKFGGLYFGANKVINPVTLRNGKSYSFSPKTNLMVEYMDNQVNLGCQITFFQYFAVTLGIQNLRQVAYGFSYTSQF